MRRLLVFLVVLSVLAGSGCGRGPEKGVNKDKDRPRPAEQAE